MQTFGRLRLERRAAEDGRDSPVGWRRHELTPLDLRLEQMLELRAYYQQYDAELEYKQMVAEQKRAAEERRQQISVWCAQAIESAERRQDVEQQSAVLRRRQDGTIEAPGGRSTHEGARAEWQQVVRRMNELVRSHGGSSVSTPAVGPASSCWGSSPDRNAQRGQVQKQQAEAADLAALDAAEREQAEAADVWL